MKDKVVSYKVTFMWCNKLLLMNKFLIHVSILDGEEKINALIIFFDEKYSHIPIIKKRIIN